MQEHLTGPELSELLDDEAGLEEFVPRVLHLVTCARCRDRFQRARPEDVSLLARKVFGRERLPPIPRHSPEDASWKGLLDRSLAKVDRALTEKRDATALWKQASIHPGGRRWLEIANRRRFHTLGFAYRILDEVENLQPRDPREAEGWCDIALQVVRRLSEDRYGAGPLHDVQARAYALRANCRRICNDLTAADRDFQQAENHLSMGSGEPLEPALVYRLEASLRRDQGRFAEARELLRWAAAIYRSVHDTKGLATVAIKEAILSQEGGEPEEAISILEGLLDEVDVDSLTAETRVVLEQNLTLYLTEAGDVEEASRRLPELRSRAAALAAGRRDQQMRLDWLEGMIRERQGRSTEAEAQYLKARDAFLEEGRFLDAAVVSLDLAALYLDLGRDDAAARLAKELSSLLWEGDLHREAVAALMLFQEAALRQTATARYARDVSASLQQLRGRPVVHTANH